MYYRIHLYPYFEWQKQPIPFFLLKIITLTSTISEHNCYPYTNILHIVKPLNAPTERKAVSGFLFLGILLEINYTDVAYRLGVKQKIIYPT